MTPTTNIGWQYYRNYFHCENLVESNLDSGETEKRYKAKNKALTEVDYEIMGLIPYYESIKEDTISLYTTYPGLLIGSGYQHEVSAKGELKLGFFFDFTTGLPIIPGSSVKGLLRSAFPKWGDKDKTPDSKKWVKTFWIKSLLSGRSIDELSDLNEDEKKNIKEEIVTLELIIFEGIKDNSKTKPEEKYLSIYERDIFFDAIATSAGQNNWILGTDSLTPHIKDGMTYEQAMLKNPIPIPFLKILPNVQFTFHFDLSNRGLEKEVKIDLFTQILLTLGIGAKTNVGYGQLSKNPTNSGVTQNDNNRGKEEKGEKIDEPKKEHKESIDDMIKKIIVTEAQKKLMCKGSSFLGKIELIKNDNCLIKISVDEKPIYLKKKKDRISKEEVTEGMNLKVTFNDNYGINPNFSTHIISS